MKEFTWNDIMEVEDSLQTADIFFNGSTGRRNCHSDSYGTCVDFAKLDAWWNTQKFEIEQIKYCVEYWKENVNMQPPLRLIAFTLERKFK